MEKLVLHQLVEECYLVAFYIYFSPDIEPIAMSLMTRALVLLVSKSRCLNFDTDTVNESKNIWKRIENPCTVFI